MIDKELLYDKAEHVLELLETLRDIEIDEVYFKKVLAVINNDLDYAIDWLEHIVANEIVGPKK